MEGGVEGNDLVVEWRLSRLSAVWVSGVQETGRSFGLILEFGDLFKRGQTCERFLTEFTWSPVNMLRQFHRDRSSSSCLQSKTGFAIKTAQNRLDAANNLIPATSSALCGDFASHVVRALSSRSIQTIGGHFGLVVLNFSPVQTACGA